MENKKENIVLEIEGKSIECDKSLLINNSDYFSAMFAGSFKESLQKNIKIEVIVVSLWILIYNFLLVLGSRFKVFQYYFTITLG